MEPRHEPTRPLRFGRNPARSCSWSRSRPAPGPASVAFLHLAFANALEGLRKVVVRGDGRCLFRAIARGIAHLEGRSLSETMERRDADALRMAAHQQICVKRRTEFEKGGLIEGNMATYCDSMRHPSFYGGEPEMYVLSDLLRRPIWVYLERSRGQFTRIVEYGATFRTAAVRVLYNGVNHYDMLVQN